MPNDAEDKQIDGAANFFKSWPGSDVKDWPGSTRADLGLADLEGGSWTGSNSYAPFMI